MQKRLKQLPSCRGFMINLVNPIIKNFPFNNILFITYTMKLFKLLFMCIISFLKIIIRMGNHFPFLDIGVINTERS